MSRSAINLGTYYSSAVAVTPDDAGTLAPTLALHVGTAGNLRVNTLDGQDIVIPNVPVGVFRMAVIRVWNTNTTAANIVALR